MEIAGVEVISARNEVSIRHCDPGRTYRYIHAIFFCNAIHANETFHGAPDCLWQHEKKAGRGMQHTRRSDGSDWRETPGARSKRSVKLLSRDDDGDECTSHDGVLHDTRGSHDCKYLLFVSNDWLARISLIHTSYDLVTRTPPGAHPVHRTYVYIRHCRATESSAEVRLS